MLMRLRLVTALLSARTPAALLIALLTLGCASDDRASDAGPAPHDAAADASSDADGGDASPCAKLTAALQDALDAAHDVSKTDAVLAVKVPDCGVRYVSSGPSQYEAATLQRIASITKTYVASLVLELYADGLLSLSDPISNFFEGVPGDDAIHIEHLLWHESGIAPYENTEEFQVGAYVGRKWEPIEMIELALQQETRFEPGTYWEYANVNYTMLGVIAEQVTGEPLATLLRERIFTPLGLDATFSDGYEPIDGALATGRGTDGSDLTNALDPSTFWGAGHLVATPNDVVTWIEARATTFHSIAALPKFEELREWRPSRAGWQYGPGTIVLDESLTFGGGRAYGHGGDLPGYHSMAFYFPDKNVTVVTVNDSDGITAAEIRKPFFAALQVIFEDEAKP